MTQLNPAKLGQVPVDVLENALREVLAGESRDRQQMQILYYQPASDECELVHRSRARVLGIGGGNRAGKTDTSLVEIVGHATGVFPEGLHDVFAAKFLNKPINARICLESLTTVLHPVMLPKLRWWHWEGIDEPGGERGHYGWVPKMCLIDGEWERSWSEKLRILKVLCRDPENHDRILGESMIQFMSYDQDPSDFASGSFHIVMHDEPPPHSIWRENRARILDQAGRTILDMTWPDEPGIPVDWIYDEVYDKGTGANKLPDVDWIELSTLRNRNLDPKAVEAEASGWSEQTRRVRLEGQPIRFSNRIHPLFTDTPQHWCFTCGKTVVVTDGRCRCGGENVTEYCHVTEFENPAGWPCVFLLDPHPRKPHMFCWVQIDPSDDYWVVAEGEIDGSPIEVREMADEIELEHKLFTALRLIDPNMGLSPSSARDRERTWQDEFSDAGLSCDLADDSDVGRSRVNEYLMPDQHTLAPRLHFHTRCVNATYQFKRYTWDEHRRQDGRDVKQTPRAKYDDWPTMVKYLMNWLPSFTMMRHGAPVIVRPGTRKGAY